MVIAYLRVSTEKQFLANQKEEIMRFAEKNGLSIDKWYTPVSLFDFTVCRGGQSGIPCPPGCAGCWSGAYR